MVADPSYITTYGLLAFLGDKATGILYLLCVRPCAEQCGGDIGLPLPQRAQDLVHGAGDKILDAGLC